MVPPPTLFIPAAIADVIASGDRLAGVRIAQLSGVVGDSNDEKGVANIRIVIGLFKNV
jgi:hypothetical protein